MKKIKMILLLMIISITGITAVKAGGVQTDIATDPASTVPCSKSLCYVTIFPGTKAYIQGVRLTVVDSSGNRVTNSIDLINNTSIVAGSNGNLTQGYLNYGESDATYFSANGGSGQLKTLSKRYDRNELLSTGAVSGNYYGNSPSVYFWANLPDFYNGSASTTLNTFFKNQFGSTYQSDMLTIFSLIGYKDFNNATLRKNEYLLVEPLVFMRVYKTITVENKKTNLTLGAFYGTGTEIYSMLATDGNPNVSVFASLKSIWKSEIPLSIYDTASVAGLNAVTTKYDNWSSYMLNNSTRYGIASGHVWMDDLYSCSSTGCGSTTTNTVPTNPYGCNTKPTVDVTTDCTNSTTGNISDTTDWACIYKTDSSTADQLDYEFYHPNNSSLSNSYCRVVCREDINYFLSGNGMTVDAGRRFTIGTSGDYGNDASLAPVKFVGTSTCRTAPLSGSSTATIDVAKFVKEYNAANANVVSTWDNLQYWKAALKSVDNITSTSSQTFGEACVQYKECVTGTKCSGAETQNKKTKLYECLAPNKMVDVTSRAAQCGCETYEHNTTTYEIVTYYGSYNYYKDKPATSQYQTSHENNAHVNSSNTKSGVISSIQSQINSATTAYNNAVAYRDSLLVQIKQCNNFQRVYEEFSPNVSFEYDDSKYGGTYSLVSTSTTTSKTDYYAFSNSTRPYSTVNWSTAGYSSMSGFTNDSSSANGYTLNNVTKSVCSGDLTPCYSTALTYPANAYVMQTTTKTYDYSLQSSLYQYVDKTGASYNSPYDIPTVKINGNYVTMAYQDIGYSNLPVTYSSKEGTYDYYYKFYDNGLFGSNQKYYEHADESSSWIGATTTYNYSSSWDYHCTYYVNQNIVECTDECCKTNTCGSPDNPSNPDTPSDNKDINVIYRTISLTTPFPGEDGEGRTSGSNWNGTANINGTVMSYIQAYITNNRGVDTSEVYEETPMYQFVLTPANIRSIRKYNNTQQDDYNDYTLECTNGEYCKSTFLSGGVANGYFSFTVDNNNGGSCFDANKTDWDSCRYTHLGG